MKIVYIGGCIHSGTTLLNRVLNAHPKVMSLGSLKKINRVLAADAPCACGAPTTTDCPFWSTVDSALREEGRSLPELNIRSSERKRFEQDNRDLFSAVARACGADVIVDSSRKASRLRWLQRTPGLEVTPVHLYKGPKNQAGSLKRKGQNLMQCAFTYWERNLSVFMACRGNPATRFVSYEAFCQDPAGELERLLHALNLDYEPAVLDQWGEETVHTLGGNRMKKSTSSRISLDESWRERLTLMEQRWADLSCGPLWRQLERQRRIRNQ